ncbi:nuclear transport factor 2 family protein [Iodidimonas sp. SYSU 1G8]|uniref:nuclear transport factor 2 family protein n=1 Tax=Iodidimonas sp. SYSU 1G8 TaxID=3133967 RepID=UPI0031FF1792
MTALTAEEIGLVRELLEVEAVRKLMVKFTQLMDANELDRMIELFLPDARCEFGHYGVWEGREAIHDGFRARAEGNGWVPMKVLRANTNHWVELTGPDSAVGRRYLLNGASFKDPTDSPINYLGLYDEDYRKVDGEWKIQRSSLYFFWPTREVKEGFPGEFPPSP